METLDAVGQPRIAARAPFAALHVMRRHLEHVIDLAAPRVETATVGHDFGEARALVRGGQGLEISDRHLRAPRARTAPRAVMHDAVRRRGPLVAFGASPAKRLEDIDVLLGETFAAALLRDRAHLLDREPLGSRASRTPRAIRDAHRLGHPLVAFA